MSRARESGGFAPRRTGAGGGSLRLCASKLTFPPDAGQLIGRVDARRATASMSKPDKESISCNLTRTCRTCATLFLKGGHVSRCRRDAQTGDSDSAASFETAALPHSRLSRTFSNLWSHSRQAPRFQAAALKRQEALLSAHEET